MWSVFLARVKTPVQDCVSVASPCHWGFLLDDALAVIAVQGEIIIPLVCVVGR